MDDLKKIKFKWVDDLKNEYISYLRPIDWENEHSYLIPKEHRFYIKIYKKENSKKRNKKFEKEISKLTGHKKPLNSPDFYWCCDINGGFILEKFFPMMTKMKLKENLYTLFYLNQKNDGIKGFKLAKEEAVSQFEWSFYMMSSCKLEHIKTRSEIVDNILNDIDDNNK